MQKYTSTVTHFLTDISQVLPLIFQKAGARVKKAEDLKKEKDENTKKITIVPDLKSKEREVGCRGKLRDELEHAKDDGESGCCINP